MIRSLSVFVLGLSLWAIAAGDVSADVLIIGNNPNSELNAPFGLGSDGGGNPSTRYQQVFNASLFGNGPIDIKALTFYTQGAGAGGTFNPVEYDLYLSTTSAAVGSLNGSNFNGNLGADHFLFAKVTPTGDQKAGTNWTITGSDYIFNPTKGNLLLDIVVPNQVVNLNIGVAFDGFNTGFGTSSSIAQNFDNGLTADSGLTTGITFTAVPEPGPLLLLTLAGCAGGILFGRRQS